MSTRRLVDVIVLGGRVGPLSAACLLARRGYKVLHVEHEGLSGHYTDDGLRLPLEPDISPAPHSSPAILHVLGELALSTDAKRLLRPIEPALQIISPGHRFELPEEAGRRRRELSREFGEEDAARLERDLCLLLEADEALDSAVAALPPLPPLGYFERRALRKAVADLPLNAPTPLPSNIQPLGAALAGLARFSSNLFDPAPTTFHSVRSRARLLRGGVHRVERKNGGVKGSGYAALLRRRLEELGGVTLAEGNAVAEEVVVEGGRITGLKVLGDLTDYRCRYLVSGVDTSVLHRLLPLEGRRRRFDGELDRVRPRETLFSLNIVLPRRAVPVGLGELAVHVTGSETEPTEESLILLEKFDAVGEDGPNEDLVVIQASSFMPSSRRELGESYLEELRDRMLGVLRADLFPFLDRHLVLTSSPLLTRKGPARGARLMPHPLFESDIEAALGVGLLPPRTPYKNLVLACREVLPGLGTEGEFLTGHRAAEVVAHVAKRHDPLKDQ